MNRVAILAGLILGLWCLAPLLPSLLELVASVVFIGLFAHVVLPD
ncbi:hypothetical protein [Luteolibacter sp. LG18]